MTLRLAIALALATVVTALLVTLVSAWLHRVRRRWRHRRRQEMLRRIRPHLVAAAAGATDGDGAAELTEIDSEVVEEAALEMLGKLRGGAHARVVALLASRGTLLDARRELGSRRADVRARAAMLLGTAGDQEAVDELTELLDDRVTEVALVAARSLGRLGDPRAVPPLLDALDRVQALPAGVVSNSLLRIGRAAIEPLGKGLATGGPTARVAAAEVLGRLGAVEATDSLIDALRTDPEDEVRIRCARALGQIGMPTGAPALADTLASTGDLALRAVCARSLGEIGGRDAVPLLVAALDDPRHAVAVAAAEALAALGPSGQAALETTAAAGDGRPASYAREALAQAHLRRLRQHPVREGSPS